MARAEESISYLERLFKGMSERIDGIWKVNRLNC